jgi:hypothetical protein
MNDNGTFSKLRALLDGTYSLHDSHGVPVPSFT